MGRTNKILSYIATEIYTPTTNNTFGKKPIIKELSNLCPVRQDKTN
jgi:hypothetical protein